MSGFDDDFGDMVEPASPAITNGKSGDIDPAADFLAREQEQLGELEEEIGATLPVSPLAGALSTSSSRGASPSVNSTSAPCVPIAPSPSITSTIMASVVPIIQEKKEREEPAVIREWREQQVERLRQKDEEEEIASSELRLNATKELEDWYVQYREQLEMLKTSNRAALMAADKTTFVAETDDITPGTEWERVAKLCDFNPKSSRNVKDVARMRSIILQLKQAPHQAT